MRSPTRSACRRGSSTRRGWMRSGRGWPTLRRSVFREVGCHGVAEGAALAAAGPEGRLLVAETPIAGRATCAVARASAAASTRRRSAGRAAGCRSSASGRASAAGARPEPRPALAEADDVVGYRLYLDLIGPISSPASELHDSPLGEEEARARQALDLAGRGPQRGARLLRRRRHLRLRRLVFELLDPERHAGWQRLAIVVARRLGHAGRGGARAAPRSAMISARSRFRDLLDALAGDRAAAEAAAAGDFVVALYNPVSQRRREPACPRPRHPARRTAPPIRPWCWPAISAAPARPSGSSSSTRSIARPRGHAHHRVVGSCRTRQFQPPDGRRLGLYPARLRREAGSRAGE